MTKSKISNEDLAKSYLKTGNVWKTAEEVGLCGQTVHERLTKLGIIKKLNVFTEAEKERLRKEYTKRLLLGQLADLAAEMGRTKQFLCRQAKALGLTDNARPSKDIATWEPSIKPGFWEGKEHPKGFKDHTHTEESKEKMSVKILAAQPGMESKRPDMVMKMMQTKAKKYGKIGTINPNRGNWKQGWRTIGDQTVYFRSRWEANYARYLQSQVDAGVIKLWKHESSIFWFYGTNDTCVCYTPDFTVTLMDGSVEYHEVKGWMDARSRLKLDRMAIFYPNETLKVIAKAWFKDNKQLLSLLKDIE